MSNSLAIAAVTAALRARVFGRIGGSQVTVVPPDRAPDAVNGDHVNLFLYRADMHASFRNADPPGSHPGESPRPMLPLVLHYLLSSYSTNEGSAHQMLGAAMLALHAGPILSGDEIRAASAAPLAGSDLHLQSEHIKVTFESLSQDDIAKMWTAFATPFRMSASYQVSVVLIDNPVPGAAAPPVLSRGPDDRLVTRSDASSPLPAVTDVSYVWPGQPGALPGEDLALAVRNLPAGGLTARLRHLRIPATVTVPVPAPPAGATQVAVSLPGTDLPAGPWAVSLVPAAGDGPGTDDVAFGVAPVTTAVAAVPAGGTPARTRVTVTAAQPVVVGQRVAILIGAQQVTAPLLTTDTAVLEITAVLAPGTHRVRLRVDDVDSDLVDHITGRFRTGPQVEVTIP